MRRLWFLIAMLAILSCSQAQQAQAQYFGGYGAGFTPSPQALYGPNGANTGALYPNGYVQGYGYAPPPPMYNYGYGGMGYGRPMPLGQALITSAAIVALSNNRGYGGGYGYGGYGYRNGYSHQMHEIREHGGFRGGYGGYHHRH